MPTVNDALRDLYLACGGDPASLSDNHAIEDYIKDLSTALVEAVKAELPAVTSSDDDKVLTVVNGAWNKAARRPDSITLVRDTTNDTISFTADDIKKINQYTIIAVKDSNSSAYTTTILYRCSKSRFYSSGFMTAYERHFEAVLRGENSTIIKTFVVNGKEAQTVQIKTVTISDTV